MQDYYREGMQNMGTLGQYCPMMNMQNQLEAMYPMTFHIVQPAIESTCDNMNMAYGPSFTPNQEQLENMINDVYKKVEADVEDMVQEGATGQERQFFGGGRRILRDFIGTLLIANLIRRRRRPFFFGHPGFFGGFGPFGGFPIF